MFCAFAAAWAVFGENTKGKRPIAMVVEFVFMDTVL